MIQWLSLSQDKKQTVDLFTGLEEKKTCLNMAIKNAI